MEITHIKIFFLMWEILSYSFTNTIIQFSDKPLQIGTIFIPTW